MAKRKPRTPSREPELVRRDGGRALVNRRLVPDAEGYRWDWGGDGDDLDRVLWPVVLSVTEVLTGKYRRQVRRCAGEGCDLLFIDRTSGSPRKWCDIRTCGHRVS